MQLIHFDCVNGFLNSIKEIIMMANRSNISLPFKDINKDSWKVQQLHVKNSPILNKIVWIFVLISDETRPIQKVKVVDHRVTSLLLYVIFLL